MHQTIVERDQHCILAKAKAESYSEKHTSEIPFMITVFVPLSHILLVILTPNPSDVKKVTYCTNLTSSPESKGNLAGIPALPPTYCPSL